MGQISFEEVLDELGWKDGFRIPVANEENSSLEIEIEKKSRRKESLASELERLEERVKAIEKHTSNLQIEHHYNQKLITAHAAQLEAEENLARLTSGGEASITHEIRNFEREKKEIKEKNAQLERELAKIATKIEKSKKTVEFDKIKLVKLEDSLNHEEEKSQKIQTFIKIDGKHFKKLELERERLTTDLESYKKAVIRAVDEVNEMEIMLDKTAKLYVQTLKEQSQLINCWKQSVFVLKQRDNGIQDALREIDNLREIGRERMEAYREAEQFLDNQINSNKQLEDSIRKCERKLIFAKNERAGVSREIEAYRLELKNQTKISGDLAGRTRQTREETKRKKILIEKKRKKVDDQKTEVQGLRGTLDEMGNRNFDAGDGAGHLEEMIEKEEKRRIVIEKETSRLQNLVLRTAGRISDLESEKKILELRKHAELKKSEVLAAYEIREKKRLDEKKKLVYHLDFDIEKCKMRLERASGAGVGVDKEELEKKQKIIENLEKILNEKIQLSKLLQGQIASLEHDMRKVSNSLSGDKDELQRLRNKKQDLSLLMEGGEKSLKSMISQNEDRQVEESILGLRVSQAERLLANIGDKLYNLDKYRLQIEAAMRERKAEIKVQKEALNLEKRFAMGACSELRGAIVERKVRLQNVQTRYDLLMAAMGNSSEGDDGSLMATAHLMAQRAQEKAMLREQGDKLDATIRRTEQEIRSMENTLRVVNACNDKYKTSLGPVDDDGEEQAEKKRVDAETYSAMETVRKRREQLELTRGDIEKMRVNYDTSLEDVRRARDEKNDKLWNVENLEGQITEQNERIHRADKSLKKLFKDIQRKCECSNDEMILSQEKDIATRELQEQNLATLQRVTELTIRHVEIEAYLKKTLAAKSISLPCAQHLRPSPSPSSRCDTNSEASDRAGSRTSVGRVRNIEARFSPNDGRSTGRNVSPARQSSRSMARNQGLNSVASKYSLNRNK